LNSTNRNLQFFKATWQSRESRPVPAMSFGEQFPGCGDHVRGEGEVFEFHFLFCSINSPTRPSGTFPKYDMELTS
jgi:hypothetical protein